MQPTEDSAVGAALDRFVQRHGQRFPSLHAPFDPEWRSPCELDTVTQPPPRQVRWRPLRRPVPIDPFAGLARALEMPIHPDAKAFWGRYWSGNLEAEAADGHVSLLQLWNEDDADRLVENLIGHALAKRRARSPFTVFFACTEPDSELFLSIDNDSGQIMLEAPGSKPLRTVAPTLAGFLDALEPAPAADDDGV
ncbi:MAG: SecY-interacting protein Syd [Pseudomonadales bacterium]